MFWLVIAALTLTGLSPQAHASSGDRSMYFEQCLDHCKDDCDYQVVSTTTTFQSIRPRTWKQSVQKFWHESLFGWDCREECKYSCMWRTVDHFHQHQRRTPQFFGKWPFLRIFSIQEPASAVASVLNLISYLYAVGKFQARVPPTAPTYGVWFTYGWIAIFTWIFSTIFHCRDLPLTESFYQSHRQQRLDYLSAFATVAFTLFIYLVRCVVGWQDTFRVWSLFVFMTAFYLHHAYSMVFVHFDYGYNMTVNLSFGIAASIGLLTWCGYNWRRLPHVRSCATFVLLVDSLVLLEVFDFPPLLWSIDAHALWHFATVPLPYYWYKFATDDCLYLYRLAQKQAMRSAEEKLLEKVS